MRDKFYTINQVAELLDMHHKTIRNFITEGKLKASKVGKQWRISHDDIYFFMEKNKAKNGDVPIFPAQINKELTEEDQSLTFTTSDTKFSNISRPVNVSTVVDIAAMDQNQYMRVSNTLIAIMNSKDPNMRNSTVNVKYFENEHNVKILLWGDIRFVEEMLSTITLLIEKE